MATDENEPTRLFQYAVGQSIGIDFRGKEAAYYNYTVAGHQIIIALRNMTTHEAQQVRIGGAQFALTVRDGIIFLLCKFGDLPWMDMPYQWWLNQPELRTDPPPVGPTQRILMTVVAVDTMTNLVQGIRAITLSNDLSRALHDVIRRQAQSAWKGAAAHDHQLAKIYRRFTTDDLLGQATIVSEPEGQDAAEVPVIEASFIAEMVASHIYATYPNEDLSSLPTEYSLKEFVEFHGKYNIPLEADDEPIDVDHCLKRGTIKAMAVEIDGGNHSLWLVQPGYYSEDFGFEDSE